MKYDLPRDILIHGVYSTRKTAQAATASKNYLPLPAVAPFPSVVKLDDVAYIGWDSQATLSLPHLNIELPEDNFFNTHGRTITIPGKEDELIIEPITETINAIRKWALKRAKAGVKFFVHDTISAKDSRIVTHFNQMLENDPKKKGDVSQVLYRNVLATHTLEMQWWQNLSNGMGTTNIWLCHTGLKGQDAPSNDPAAKAAAEIQRKMKGLLGMELAARITGASWNYFYEQCRMVYYQTVDDISYGKKAAMWTTRSTDVAVKPGLPDNVLPDKIPADFRELFKRAAGEVK